METAMNQMPKGEIAPRLLAQLSSADEVIDSAGPILRQYLAEPDRSLFADAIIAHVRGMMNHVARQLLFAEAQAAGEVDPQKYADSAGALLRETLASNTAFLAHVHGLALEWQLCEQLEIRTGLDYALSPLVQELIGSDDAELAGSAMALLAAQTRFAQQQRRMELPLGELPGDLFHAVIVIWRNCTRLSDETAADAIERKLRDDFDESRSRLGLLARIATALGADATTALNLRHGGVALFLSVLALGSSQKRQVCALAMNERHVVRLALSLRAAGMKAQGVMNQIMFLHAEVEPPQWLGSVDPDSAADLLAQADPGASAG